MELRSYKITFRDRSTREVTASIFDEKTSTIVFYGDSYTDIVYSAPLADILDIAKDGQPDRVFPEKPHARLSSAKMRIPTTSTRGATRTSRVW